MTRPVLLDVDPGHDDTIALLLAVGHDEVDVRTVTTVAGNQTLSKVTLHSESIRRGSSATHWVTQGKGLDYGDRVSAGTRPGGSPITAPVSARPLRVRPAQ